MSVPEDSETGIARASEEDIKKQLGEEGITDLDELVRRATEDARALAEERASGGAELARNDPWCFISDNYVYKGASTLW